MRELRNALLHGAWLGIIMLPCVIWPNLFTFTLAGFGIGHVREYTEERLKHPSLSAAEAAFDALFSWKDLLGWAVFGFILGLVNLIVH